MLSEWTAAGPNGSPVGNTLHHRFSVGNEFFDLIPIHILVARVSPCSIISTNRYYCSDILCYRLVVTGQQNGDVLACDASLGRNMIMFLNPSPKQLHRLYYMFLIISNEL